MANRPPEGYQHIALSPAEGYTMSRVDGQATLREICMVSPMGEETTLRALFGLSMAGILEASQAVSDPPPGAPPPSAQARPPAASPPASAKPVPVKPPPAVVPGRTPGNGGAPKPARAPSARPRPAAPVERARRMAGPDLEGEMLQRFDQMREQDLYLLVNEKKYEEARAVMVGDTLPRLVNYHRAWDALAQFEGEQMNGAVEESNVSNAAARKKYDEDIMTRRGPKPHEHAADTGDLARLNFRHGKDQFDKGKFGEALSFFQNACDQDPSKAEFWHYLAMTQSKNPRWKKDAETNFLKALEIDPTNADMYAQLGALYARGGLHSKARDMFKRALEWDPAHALALEGMEAEEAGKKGLLGMFKK